MVCAEAVFCDFCVLRLRPYFLKIIFYVCRLIVAVADAVFCDFSSSTFETVFSLTVLLETYRLCSISA